MLLLDAHFSSFVFRICLWASIFLASISCSSARLDLSMLSGNLNSHAIYRGSLSGGSRMLCSSLDLKRTDRSILFTLEEPFTIFDGQTLCLEILVHLWKRWGSLIHHHLIQFEDEPPQSDCLQILRVVLNFWHNDLSWSFEYFMNLLPSCFNPLSGVNLLTSVNDCLVCQNVFYCRFDLIFCFAFLFQLVYLPCFLSCW